MTTTEKKPKKRFKFPKIHFAISKPGQSREDFIREQEALHGEESVPTVSMSEFKEIAKEVSYDDVEEEAKKMPWLARKLFKAFWS